MDRRTERIDPNETATVSGPVAVAGDWHGNRTWAIARVQGLAANGVELILHVGDFGIWPGNSGKKYLRSVEAVCAASGVQIWVTPGNHEDWGRLCALWDHPKRRGGDGRLLPLRLTDHIWVLPRGHRFSLTGPSDREVSFVSLGGAPSVDFPDRTEGISWWPEEQMTDADVDLTVEGGYADVMLAHDSPDWPYATGPVATIIHGDGGGWTNRALAYAAVGRERMHRAFLGVRPRLFVHGHYHVSGETTVRLPDANHDTTVWSLDCDGVVANVRLLDLDELSAD